MSNTISSWFTPFWYSAASGETTTLEMINKKREELKTKDQEPSFPKTLTPAKAIGGGVGIVGILLAVYGFFKENTWGKMLGIGSVIVGIVGYFTDKFFVASSTEPNADGAKQIKDPIFDKETLERELNYRKSFKQQLLNKIGNKSKLISELGQQHDIVAVDKNVFVIPDDMFKTYTSDGITRGRFMSGVKNNLSAQKIIDDLTAKFQRDFGRPIADEELDQLLFVGYVTSPGNIIFPHSSYRLPSSKSLGIVSHELFEQLWDTKTFSDNEREKVVMLTKTFNELKSVQPVSNLIEKLIKFLPYKEDYDQGTFAHEFWANLAYSERDDELEFKQLKDKVIKLIEIDYSEAFTTWSSMKSETDSQANVIISRYNNRQFVNWSEVLQ